MSVFSNRAGESPEEGRAYISALLGLLGEQPPLDVLRRTEAQLLQRLQSAPSDRITRPEAPGKWSVRHVVQHLADAELVWGFRMRMVLALDRPVLAGYDQDAFAKRLHYEDADAKQALQDFAGLRRANLRLLAGASSEDVERVGLHTERGEESIAYMMRLFAGHDLLHLRQIDRILDT